MSWAVLFFRYDGRLKQWRLALHNWDPGGKFGPAKDAETAEATTEVTSIEEAEKLAMQFTAGVVGAKFHVWLSLHRGALVQHLLRVAPRLCCCHSRATHS
jgi:hypothetical protein